MGNFKGAANSFVLGLLFHLSLFALSFYTTRADFLGHYFVLALDIAVVLAVGLLKGGIFGVSFSASYFLAGIVGSRKLEEHYLRDSLYPSSWIQ